jgi:hypothetical protein
VAYPLEKPQTQPSCHLDTFIAADILLIAWQNIGLKYIISTFLTFLAIFGTDTTNITISAASLPDSFYSPHIINKYEELNFLL